MVSTPTADDLEEYGPIAKLVLDMHIRMVEDLASRQTDEDQRTELLENAKDSRLLWESYFDEKYFRDELETN